MVITLLTQVIDIQILVKSVLTLVKDILTLVIGTHPW